MEQSDRYLASLTVEGRYRLLVEAVTDYAIFMLNSSGIVTSWNPGAERLKGYPANEIIGQHFSRFYTPEDKKLAYRRGHWRPPVVKESSRLKAGVSAKTGRGFGLMSLSILSEGHPANSLVLPKSRGT